MGYKTVYINSLPRDGVVTFLALVREMELKPKRNKGAYLHLWLLTAPERSIVRAARYGRSIRSRRDREATRDGRTAQRPDAIDCPADPAMLGRERQDSDFYPISAPGILKEC
jgi:hypothetical protein